MTSRNIRVIKNRRKVQAYNIQRHKINRFPLSIPFLFFQVILSDEAHFQLNELINTQNCRIWSEENPRNNGKSDSLSKSDLLV